MWSRCTSRPLPVPFPTYTDVEWPDTACFANLVCNDTHSAPGSYRAHWDKGQYATCKGICDRDPVCNSFTIKAGKYCFTQSIGGRRDCKNCTATKGQVSATEHDLACDQGSGGTITSWYKGPADAAATTNVGRNPSSTPPVANGSATDAAVGSTGREEDAGTGNAGGKGSGAGAGPGAGPGSGGDDGPDDSGGGATAVIVIVVVLVLLCGVTAASYYVLRLRNEQRLAADAGKASLGAGGTTVVNQSWASEVRLPFPRRSTVDLHTSAPSFFFWLRARAASNSSTHPASSWLTTRHCFTRVWSFQAELRREGVERQDNPLYAAGGPAEGAGRRASVERQDNPLYAGSTPDGEAARRESVERLANPLYANHGSLVLAAMPPLAEGRVVGGAGEHGEISRAEAEARLEAAGNEAGLYLLRVKATTGK